MAGPSAILTIGGDTSLLEKNVSSALRRLEKQVVFSPKINEREFNLPLGRITGGINDFNKSLDAANKRVLAFGASATIIGGTIKTIRDLVSVTVNVEKNFSEINAVLNLSSKNLAKFASETFAAARSTGQAFDTAAKAALEFSRQGLSAEETLKRVKDALTLTRQSGLEITKSVEDITAALNTFNKAGLTSTQFINKLIAVDTRFAVSSRDLAEAISRVGSTAQDAGTNFDELVGIVTSAQQITARGGAVIGNALKTIFTRVQRTDVLDQLESIGVTVRDLQNNTLPALQILKNLAGSFDTLTESQKRQVEELTAGVFQINQLKAILGDLGKSYSIASQAALASATATNEATKRNELLNKSLSALLQNTKTTFTEIGSIIGENTIANPLKRVLGDLNDNFIVDALRGINGDKAGQSIGSQIAEGILKGIANILSGPGIVFGGAIISKLLKQTTRTVVEGVSSLSSIASSKQQETSVLQGVNQVLAQATKEEQARYLVATSIAEKEKLILQLLQQQNAVRALQKTEGELLARRLITNNPQTSKQLRSIGRNAAEGYLPIKEEKNAIKMGVGGASPSAKPVVIKNFAFGRGKFGTIVANSDEYIVPHFAEGGSAIFNPEMIKKYGLPQGAKKIAAGGYIPNLASLVDQTKLIGQGIAGKVFGTKKKGLIFKDFEPLSQYVGDPSNAIRQEYAISKLGKELGLPVSNVYGSASRSVQRGGIFKEYVEGDLGSDIKPSDANSVISYLSKQFKQAGIDPKDLRTSNFVVRGGTKGKSLEQIQKDSVVIDPGFFQNDYFKNNSIYNKYLNSATGYIPNLNKALTEAFLRESKAGIPKDQIYVDTDPRLKSTQNPLGLLIANKRDEPFDGSQGVDRVIRQGKNPKKAGMASGFIPSFALFDRVKDPNLRDALGINLSPREIDALNEAILTYTQGLQTNSKALQELSKLTIESLNLDKTSKKIVRLALKDEADQVKQLALEDKKQKELIATQNKVIAEETAKRQQRNAAIVKQIEQDESIRQQAANAPIIRQGSRATQEQIRAFEERRNASARGVSTFLASDIRKLEQDRLQKISLQLDKTLGGFIGSFRDATKVTETLIRRGGLTGEDAAALRGRGQFLGQRNAGRIQNFGLAASFALPFGAGFVGEGRGGTTEGRVRGGLSGALQGAGTGAAFGSLFGPLGTLIGGGVGAATGGIFGVISKLEKSFAELAESVNEVNAKNIQQVNSISNYIQLQQQLNDAISGGASERDINALIQQQNALLSQINPTDRRSLVQSGSNIEKLTDVLRRANFQSNRTGQAGDVVTAFARARENTGLFNPQLAGKDIEDAGNALASSIDITNDKIKKSFDVFRGSFRDDPAKAFSKFANDLGFSNDNIQDILTKYKNKPEQLQQIFANTVEKVDTFAEDLKLSSEKINRRTLNIDFSKLINRFISESSLSSQINQQNQLSSSSILTGRRLAVSSVNGVGISRIQEENQINLENAIRNLNIQLDAAKNRQFNTVLGAASTKNAEGQLTPALFEKLSSISSIEDFNKLASTIEKENKDLAKVLRDSYEELVLIKNNGQNTINELRESNKIREINARLEERGRILSGSPFNAQNAQSFFSARLEGRTSRNIRGGRANQLNALSSQIDIADQLGLGETNNTRRLRDFVRGQSSQINFAEILSTILEREVSDDTASINEALDEVLGRKVKSINDAIDRDVAERIKSGIEALKFTPEQATKLLSGDTTQLDSAVKSGKVSLGEGGLISGFEKLSTTLVTPLTGIDSKLGSDGPIATLLAQIKENRQLVAQSDERSRTQQEILALEKQISDLNTSLKEGQQSQVGLQPVITNIQNELTKRFTDPNAFKNQKEVDKQIRELGATRSFLIQQQKQGKTLSETIQTAQTDPNAFANAGFPSGKQFAEFLSKIAQLESKNINQQFSGSINPQSAQILKDLQEITRLERKRAELIDKLTSNDISRRPKDSPFAGLLNKAFADANSFGNQSPANIPTGGATQTQEITSSTNTPENTEKSLNDRQNRVAELNRIITDSEKELKSAATLSLTKRIELTRQLIQAQIELAREEEDGLKTFTLGFKQRFTEFKNLTNDYSEIGANLAASLEGNLGNAFGDFVTGAKKGKEAFRDFILSVLNDASRAFASKAVQSLLGGLFGGTGSGGSIVTRNKGGPIPNLNYGGKVPALLTGGEYYFTPQQVSNIEGNYGRGYMQKLNAGKVSTYNTGGLVKGGSGYKDDVFARLNPGGFVVKKSSVNKYGSDTLKSLASGATPQKRFYGGGIYGALIGAALGYFTSPKEDRKRNALIGAGVGFVAGGLAQNYSQTGSAFKSNPNAGTFQFGGRSTYGANGQFNLSSIDQANSPFARSNTNSSFKQGIYQAGIAGALGLASQYLTPSEKQQESASRYTGPEDPLPIPGQYAYLRQKSDGGYYVGSYGRELATRRLNSGGFVKTGSGYKDDVFAQLNSGGFVLNRGATMKYGNSIKRFAEGGNVDSLPAPSSPPSIDNIKPTSEPNVYIKVDINNQGNVQTQTQNNNGEQPFGQEFAERLNRTIRNVVKDEFTQQSRVGAQSSQLKRARQ